MYFRRDRGLLSSATGIQKLGRVGRPEVTTVKCCGQGIRPHGKAFTAYRTRATGAGDQPAAMSPPGKASSTGRGYEGGQREVLRAIARLPREQAEALG